MIDLDAIREFMESTSMDFAIRRRVNALIAEVDRLRGECERFYGETQKLEGQLRARQAGGMIPS